ncbi:hypothetical protein CU044_2319 [Streptomyces sp. L-9-10]|nr:hypothetical protein CU044_2319 [Streptomyces sp. L-9-10]
MPPREITPIADALAPAAMSVPTRPEGAEPPLIMSSVRGPADGSTRAG